MIIRPLILTINDKVASLNEKVTVYLYDKGICLEILLKSVKYGFNGQAQLHNENIEYASDCNVYCQRANGEVFLVPNTFIEDNKVHIMITEDWTDEQTLELGQAKLQIVLISEDGGQVTLPPFDITIAEPIYRPSELLVETGESLLNSVGGGFKISELQTTHATKFHVPVTHDGATYKREIDMDTLATKQDLEEVNVDTSIYYTKQEVDTKLSTKAEILVMTQAEYDALTVIIPTTIYIIVEE